MHFSINYVPQEKSSQKPFTSKKKLKSAIVSFLQQSSNTFTTLPTLKNICKNTQVRAQLHPMCYLLSNTVLFSVSKDSRHTTHQCLLLPRRYFS